MGLISIENNNQGYYGLVRKTDLLLRAEFPYLETTIYQKENEDFVIHLKNRKVDFQAVEHEFEKSIRPIFVPLKLSLKKPGGKSKIIAQLQDKDIPKGLQGVLMPKSKWADMLMSKFPNINFYKISDEAGIVHIHIANYWIEDKNGKKYQFLNRFQEGKLVDFLKKHQSGVEFRIHIDELEEPPPQKHGFSKDDTSAYYCNRLGRNKPKYIQRDDSIWYDNVNRIFEGTFKKNNLFFLLEDEYACYIDFSIYPNVDLRYCILLYQRIFLTPPITKDIEEWFPKIGIKRAHFMELVRRERITIVLVQEVSCYDRKFLDEVYAINRNGLVTQRAVGSLQQCDIVETADNYIFGDGISAKELKFISDIVAKQGKMDASFVFKSLAWPILAKRKSFDVLQSGGILSASVYGVNKIISNPPNGNLSESAEYLVNRFSYAAHLSNAFNATYFPVRGEDGFTDAVYTESMGTLLNFYKSATMASFKNYVTGEQLLLKGSSFINPIELFKMNDYISILELEEVLSKESIYPNSKRLIETLANLSQEEQTEKMQFYNQEVKKFLNAQIKANVIVDLTAQAFTTALGMSSGLPTGLAMFILKLLSKKPLRRLSPVRGLMEKIDLAMNSNEADIENIHFLSKINRVAKFKEI
ncbi:hypothetical protein J8281_06300 [Aquimarina sp. U1-2]|uniref:hypothetical protein n=1 Tax=Aquimarina sp. U1-2 TaxID=2823141 RepID=UPI001AECFF17|nr:hypothetical protein [Aquimarina sp. U1-2]MBP2831795.1 hypothetical protein [Aquimarina sp. U1-2]